jgi:hypothetical protein
MSRFLTIALVASSFVLASCASKKACTSCTSAKAPVKACCGKDGKCCKSGHKH